MTGIERHEIERRLEYIEKIVERILHIVRHLEHPHTPTSISFQGDTMLPATAGNTLVYTGTLAPSGSVFPAGTTFTVTSSDPTVTPTVDVDGLTVTIPLPSTFVDDAANPLTIAWATSTFVPNPSTAPASLTSTITPTVPTLTPTGVTFVQTV